VPDVKCREHSATVEGLGAGRGLRDDRTPRISLLIMQNQIEPSAATNQVNTAVNTAAHTAAIPVKSGALEYLPVALFGSVMGLTGLSLAWHLAHTRFGVPDIVADGAGRRVRSVAVRDNSLHARGVGGAHALLGGVLSVQGVVVGGQLPAGRSGDPLVANASSHAG
jgi:hypothetical protein